MYIFSSRTTVIHNRSQFMKPKVKKPEKPRHDFPLTAHPGGSWCKKIGGRLRYFGPWGDAEGAERRYEVFKKTGVKPKDDGAGTLQQISNIFLNHHSKRAIDGELNVRSFRDLQTSILAFVKLVGRETRIGDIGSAHFAAFRAALVNRGLHGSAMNKTITLIKQLFNYAYDEDLIDKPMRYGQSFEKVSAATIRKNRKDKEFTVEDVRGMIEVSAGPLKAFILLAVNCGFGNNDIGALNEDAVDLKAGIIDYARTKTGEKRRCVLWPETIKAMKATLAERSRPLTDADVGAFFITRFGRRFVRAENKIDPADKRKIVGQTVVDSVSTLFWKMMKTAGIWADGKSDGRNFYSLRRFFRTVADECGDPHAAALIMGHGTGTIARLYVQRITDERLLAVSNHVREKLFSKRTEPGRK